MNTTFLAILFVFMFIGFPLIIGLLNGIFSKNDNFQFDAYLEEYRDEDYYTTN